MGNRLFTDATMKSTVGKLRYMGYGVCYAWSTCLFSIQEFGSDLTPDLRLSSLAVGWLICLILLSFSRRYSIRGHRTPGMLVPALITSVGTLLYALPVAAFGSGVQLLGLLLTGAFIWIPGAWFEAYVGLDSKETIALVGYSLLGAAVACLLICICTVQTAALLMSLLPLIAYALLPASPQNDDPDMHPQASENAEDAHTAPARAIRAENTAPSVKETLSSLPWKALIGLAVISLATSSIRYSTPIAGSLLGSISAQFFILPLALAISCWLIASRTRGGFDLMLLVKGVLIVLAVLLFLAVDAFGASGSLAYGINMMVEMCTWLLLVFLGKESAAPSIAVFYVGWMLDVLGTVVACLFLSIEGVPLAIYAFIIMVLLIIASLFLFSKKIEIPLDVDGEVEDAHGSVEDVQQRSQAPDQQFTRVDEFASLYHLTPRESEVFQLWITGHGFKYIEDTLFVSEATAKTHVYHIYEKCSVHSRADILALYENWLDENSR